ncbi:hypothetical protein [Mangrovicoccus ximenensis]|uniref:hypothetical protein n=1 Tax=Mangrovicoccus ximenensis TaxID=1911570 RepID=UPI000D36B0E6|nr:hypothetical protein [Mangrovicoccus ximenensis]
MEHAQVQDHDTGGLPAYLHLDEKTCSAMFGADPRWTRLVLDASYLHRKASVAEDLATNRTGEIVLDLNAAETAAPGRFARKDKLPWANRDRPWTPEDFSRSRNDDLILSMAQFAAAHHVHTVLAPTHLLGDMGEPWLPVDADGCRQLRAALDRLGCAHVTIDYPVLAPLARVREHAWRKQVISALADLPFGQLWLRVGGFGLHEDKRAGILVVALQDFQALGRPIVLDMAGGVASLAVLACGAVSALGHGIAKNEKMDFSEWRKQPKVGSSGGAPMASRAYLAQIDAFLKQDQLADFAGQVPAQAMIDRHCQNFLRDRAAQLDNAVSGSAEERAAAFVADQRQRLWELEQEIKRGDAPGLAATQLDKARQRTKVLIRGLEETGATRFRSFAVPLLQRSHDALQYPLDLQP